MQSAIKSAKQGQGVGAPRPLHTERCPPYTAAFAARLQDHYTSFPRFCIEGGEKGRKKKPAFHASVYGMENSVPVPFLCPAGGKRADPLLKICCVLRPPAAPGPLVEREEVQSTKQSDVKRSFFPPYRLRPAQGSGAVGKTGRPERFSSGGPFFAPSAIPSPGSRTKSPCRNHRARGRSARRGCGKSP